MSKAPPDPCSRRLHGYRPVVVTADDTCCATVIASPWVNPLVEKFTPVCAVPFQLNVAVIVAGKAALFFDCNVAVTTGFWFTLSEWKTSTGLPDCFVPGDWSRSS